MTKRNLQHAVNRLDLKKKNRENLIPGILGMAKGDGVVQVPNRPNYVYVRLRSNTSEVIQAFNDSVSLVYNLPVFIKRDELNPTIWRVHGRDSGVYGSSTSGSGNTVINQTTSYLPVHGGSHSFAESGGGGDVTWVYGRQFIPGLVAPSGSAGAGSVTIQPFVYYHQDYDEYKYGGGVGTSSLLPFKPTDNTARMVLVYLDTSSNPQLMGGDTFPATTTGTSNVLQYIPTINRDVGMPLAAVRLVSGTSTIQWNNLYDLRPLMTGDSEDKLGLSDNGSFVVSGTSINFAGNFNVTASGKDATVTNTASDPITFHKDNVIVATGTALDFLGNFTVTATGTTVYVQNTAGGGGGGTNTVYYDDSVYQVTGTAVSFDSNLSVAVTGSTVYVSSTDTNTDTPTYPAVYDDNVFVATGTALVFNDNINVAVTGTSIYLSSVDTVGGGGGTNTTYYDDSVFVVTGTSVSFDSNLSVSSTGTIVYVSATDTDTNTDTPTYPAIYDDGVFQTTGTALSFDSNLSVAFTGTSVFVSSTASGGGSDLAIFATGTWMISGTTGIVFDETLSVTSTGTIAFIEETRDVFWGTYNSSFSAGIIVSPSYITLTGSTIPFIHPYDNGDALIDVDLSLSFVTGSSDDFAFRVLVDDVTTGLTPAVVYINYPQSTTGANMFDFRSFRFIKSGLSRGGHVVKLQANNNNLGLLETGRVNISITNLPQSVSYLLDEEYNYLLDEQGNYIIEG